MNSNKLKPDDSVLLQCIIHFQAEGWSEDYLSLEYVWSTTKEAHESRILNVVSYGKNMSVKGYGANFTVRSVIAT